MKNIRKTNDRKIINIKKDIGKYENMKVRGLNVGTLKEYDEKMKQIKFMEVKESVKRYVETKHTGSKMIDFAANLGITRQTFAAYANHYEKHGVMPTKNNKGRTPWNKMKESDVLKIVRITSKIIDKVEKFAGEPVPTLMSLLFDIVKKEMDKKYPKIHFSLSTFRRIFKSSNIKARMKYETKMSRRITKKLEKLYAKLKECSLIKNRINVEMEEGSVNNQILATDEQVKSTSSYEVSKRRNEAEPGLILQWDGSMDQFKSGSRVTRMQAIDHNTLTTMGLAFVRNENNKGFQMLISQIINNHGIPSMILGDKRKGVDPVNEGALNAVVCKLLGIALNLDSNSIHKAELESLNGKMHPLVTTYSALNNINSISNLNDRSQEIIDATNLYFKRPQIDTSHLRQASDEIKEILAGKIIQKKITATEGVIINKCAYAAYDKNQLVELERGTWAIVSMLNGKPRKLWTDKGIYRLVKMEEDLKFILLAKNGICEMADKHFIDNGVMILNRETYYALFKDILNEGRLAAIKSKSWMLDEQIKKKLKKIQSFNR